MTVGCNCWLYGCSIIANQLAFLPKVLDLAPPTQRFGPKIAHATRRNVFGDDVSVLKLLQQPDGRGLSNVRVAMKMPLFDDSKDLAQFRIGTTIEQRRDMPRKAGKHQIQRQSLRFLL